MAMTPLAFFNEDLENPSILASHDGTTWVVPNGLRNPIDLAMGNDYHSDPELVLADGVLFCFYRRTDRSTTATVTRYRTSTDGVHWSPLTLITGVPTTDWLTSLSIVKLGDIWHMFYVYYLTPGSALGGRTVGHRTATDPAGPWSEATVGTLNGMPANRNIWHLTVRRWGGRWLLIGSDAQGSDTGTDGKILLGTSADGDTWHMSEHVIDHDGGTAWDDALLYRPTMSIDGDTAQVFYGGVQTGGLWWIGRTEIPLRRWPPLPV